MNKIKRLSLMSVAVGALIAGVASAQDAGAENFYSRDKYEAVRDRVQPEFDPEPIRLGTFVVNAVAEAGLTATDNVFASATNTKSDVIARIGAQVSATTDWSIHAVGFDAGAYRNEYLDQGDESTNDLLGRLRGRLDVTRDISIGAAVFAESRAEPRTEFVNAVGIDRPVEFMRTGATLDANYQNDRVRWTNSVGITEEDFDDGRQIGTGLNIDQDFRDRTLLEGRTRLSYAVTPNFAVFGQGTFADSEYDQPQLFGTALRRRDSRGYTVSAGADFELEALVRGDIAIGYLNENKDDNFFADVSGFAVDGRLQWFPTQLTTVGFNAGRRVVDVGAIESPSAVETRLGVRVDHELRRNVIVSGFVTGTNYEFEEINRDDDNIELGVLGTYKMNKRIHLEAFARYLERDVSGTQVFGNPNYDISLLGIGLKIFP